MSNTVNDYTETDLGNISLNPRGEYDSSAEYEYLDTVSYQGGSYFCLAELETTITGIAPDAGHNSEHWQMIAAPGDMTPEYTAAYNDVINKAVQVEISRAAVELAQQEIEAVQTDVQQLHSDTVQAVQEAENSKNSAANSAQSAEQSRKTVSESEQNINGQIAGFDSRVSEAVEQSKEEINTTKQQAINTITNQQTTSVNTVKTEGEKIITRVGNDAKTVADDRATVEETTQTVLNNAQEVARNAQTVASNTENAAASAESAKTFADNAAQSAKSVEDASKQIEQNKKDVASLKEDVSNKITKFYASNQDETHLADSDDGKIMDMIVYGKSEQKQYSGKNLINSDEYYSEYKQSDGTYKGTANNFSIISVPIGKYIGTQITVSCKVIVPSDTLSIVIQATINGVTTEGNKITSGKSGVITITIVPKTESDTIHITYGSGGGGIIVVSEVQIEKGSEATSYEPYTGGIPSPNPDYPQEIKSVVNPTMKVCGNNFYSGSDLIGLAKAYVMDFMPVILHKGKICISFDAFSDTSNGNYLINVEYFDANKESIGSNDKADLVGNNISHINFNFDESTAGYNNEALDFKNVLYVKVKFYIYANTATEITYKNIMISATDSDFEPYKPIQTVTLPYTLNAIPVKSGGNVTINGQQYVADYVDVERGKLIRMCERGTFNTKNGAINEEYRLAIDVDIAAQNDGGKECIFSTFEWTGWGTCVAGTKIYIKNIKKSNNELYTAQELKELGLDFDAIYQLAEKQEIDLTTEQITAFKELVTYYPVTNVSVNSEQLDGYTVFNYPISMANGWNYVKKQLNDNRDYIYDMDIQSAEAYVNSEYAVALTELEV